MKDTDERIRELFQFEAELFTEIHSMEIREIEPGQTILKEHEYIKGIPLVLEGSIKLRKMDLSGREVIFYRIHPGESCILSITSCLNDKGSHAEAITDKRTRMVVVGAGSIRSWMEQYPSWRRFVVRLYYDRMANLLTLLDQVIFASVDSRLIKHLKQKAVDNELEITHQELAGELGTAREVISRLLKQMERNELISLERGKIKILKPL